MGGDSVLDGFAAASKASSGAAGSVVAPCPLRAKWAIEAQVIGVDSKPVSNITVTLVRKEGGELRLNSFQDGFVRFTGLEAGQYSLGLPDLDGDSWEQIVENPLPPELARCMGGAAWGPALESSIESTTDRTVVEGDCFSSLGFQHGFLPETLAKLPQNAWIHGSGRNLRVLFPGNPKSQSEGPAETVAIPPKSLKSVPAMTGMRYIFRHKGVPEYLRVTFIDPEGDPFANTSYLLEIEDLDGGPPLSIVGQTDPSGLLEEPIPPDAERAFVTLGRHRLTHTIELDIGYLDPIDGIAGVQERLTNLGYTCGEEDGEIGPLTNWALRRFQAANDLTVSGKIDTATKAELAKQHHA